MGFRSSLKLHCSLRLFYPILLLPLSAVTGVKPTIQLEAPSSLSFTDDSLQYISCLSNPVLVSVSQTQVKIGMVPIPIPGENRKDRYSSWSLEIGSLTARLIQDGPILSGPIAEDFIGADLGRCSDTGN